MFGNARTEINGSDDGMKYTKHGVFETSCLDSVATEIYELWSRYMNRLIRNVL